MDTIVVNVFSTLKAIKFQRGQVGKKYWICLESKSMTPRQGNTSHLLFLPATPSCPSWTLEVLLELIRHPSRAVDLLRGALLSKLQRIKDTVRCGKLGAEVTVKNNSCKP